MRAYTVAVTALALDVPIKWLDNVLSHHAVPGVAQGRQGLQRRLPSDSIVVLAVAKVIHRELGAPLGKALELAVETMKGGSEKHSTDAGSSVGRHVRLVVDVDAVRTVVESRLREAVEFGAAPRRGRPPMRRA